MLRFGDDMNVGEIKVCIISLQMWKVVLHQDFVPIQVGLLKCDHNLTSLQRAQGSVLCQLNLLKYHVMDQHKGKDNSSLLFKEKIKEYILTLRPGSMRR